MSSYLGRHFDASLDVSGIGSREEIEGRQIERLNRALSVITVSQTIPRRLGSDATDEELALDKKRARRVAFALHQALRGWTKKGASIVVDETTRREGAQLDWATWQPAFLTETRQQLQCAATWAVKNSEERWGKSAVVRFENELKWVEFALRD
jgi:hypothetical protein